MGPIVHKSINYVTRKGRSTNCDIVRQGGGSGSKFCEVTLKKKNCKSENVKFKKTCDVTQGSESHKCGNICDKEEEGQKIMKFVVSILFKGNKSLMI